MHHGIDKQGSLGCKEQGFKFLKRKTSSSTSMHNVVDLAGP